MPAESYAASLQAVYARILSWTKGRLTTFDSYFIFNYKSRKSEKTVVFFCFLSYHKPNPIPDIPSAFLHKFPFLFPLYVERSIQLYSKVHSIGIIGVEGVPILVEADVSDGLRVFPWLDIFLRR